MPTVGDSLVSFLPRQPAAGKLEYFLDVSAGNALGGIAKEEPVIIRFKGPVPLMVLLAHVLAMFIAMMVAVRAAMGALWGEEGSKRLAVVALAAIVMLVVYLIPHSLGGSQLDYSKVDEGVDPAEAVGTGR